MCMNVRWDASGLRQLMQHYHELKLSTDVQLGYRFSLFLYEGSPWLH